MSKQCTVCNQIKPLSEYYRDKIKKDGRASTCKECAKARTVRWRKKHPERAAAASDRWRKKHKDKMSDYNRKWEFGLELGEYDRMYNEQGGACYICRRPQDVLHVDHNHKTGKVRGLLCRSCNFALGFLGDNPLWLEWAATYLRIFDG